MLPIIFWTLLGRTRPARSSSHPGSAVHRDSVPDCKTAGKKSGFARGGALPANESPIATCAPADHLQSETPSSWSSASVSGAGLPLPERPHHTGCGGPVEVFMNGALANRASAGYGPLPQLEAKARASLILRMDNLLVGTLSPVTQIGETACLL